MSVSIQYHINSRMSVSGEVHASLFVHQIDQIEREVFRISERRCGGSVDNTTETVAFQLLGEKASFFVSFVSVDLRLDEFGRVGSSREGPWISACGQSKPTALVIGDGYHGGVWMLVYPLFYVLDEVIVFEHVM